MVDGLNMWTTLLGVAMKGHKLSNERLFWDRNFDKERQSTIKKFMKSLESDKQSLNSRIPTQDTMQLSKRGEQCLALRKE